MHFRHTSYAIKIYPPGVFEIIGEFEKVGGRESCEGNNMYTLWDSRLRERGAGGGGGSASRSTFVRRSPFVYTLFAGRSCFVHALFDMRQLSIVASIP